MIETLAAAGFTVEDTGELVFVGFPDGLDGCVRRPDRLSTLDLDELKSLARRRAEAISAITAVLAEAGWGARMLPTGHAALGHGGASSSIALGLPLTFWLRHESVNSVVRRFVNGFVADSSDEAIDLAMKGKAFERSARLYEEHLEAEQQIFDNAVELESDPLAEAEMMWEIEEFSRHEDAKHRAWLDANRVEGGTDRQLSAVLLTGRQRVQEGQGVWLGADPLWWRENDRWITAEEWVSWAENGLNGFSAEHCRVLLLHAPSRFAERVHQLMKEAERLNYLEYDWSDAQVGAYFLGDLDTADWVMSIQQDQRVASSLADAGLLDALHELFAALHAVDMSSDAPPFPWLHDIADELRRIGWPWFRALLTPKRRDHIASCCRHVLQTTVDMQTAAVTAQSIALIALGLRDVSLAAELVGTPRWQEALLCRLDGIGFLVLKESILALSLLLPGPVYRELIDRAVQHLDQAFEPHLVDTTALALAVAWGLSKAQDDDV